MPKTLSLMAVAIVFIVACGDTENQNSAEDSMGRRRRPIPTIPSQPKSPNPHRKAPGNPWDKTKETKSPYEGLNDAQMVETARKQVLEIAVTLETDYLNSLKKNFPNLLNPERELEFRAKFRALKARVNSYQTRGPEVLLKYAEVAIENLSNEILELVNDWVSADKKVG